jgi:hypothetical protein
MTVSAAQRQRQTETDHDPTESQWNQKKRWGLETKTNRLRGVSDPMDAIVTEAEMMQITKNLQQQ